MSKEELVRRHGWKIIDLDEKTRAPASVILKQKKELQKLRRGLRSPLVL